MDAIVYLVAKKIPSGTLDLAGFYEKMDQRAVGIRDLSCVDSSLAGKTPEPAAGHPPSRAFTKKHTRGLSADEDIMYADHSLGGKIANRSLSTGEIFSSGDSFVLYFFYHS